MSRIGELYSKLMDAGFDEIPGWIGIKGKAKLVLNIEGGQNLTVTPKDVVLYYYKDARDITSGCRSLAGLAGDWRLIDDMAKNCLEIFKVINRNALKKEGKVYGMELKG